MNEGMIRSHQYSCVLDSFAFIAEIHPETLMRDIGHRGTGEGEPRGFHSQEIIEPLLARGFSITPIELYPVATDPLSYEHRIVDFIQYESNVERFARHLRWSDGVLCGVNKNGVPHAAAWLNHNVFDPVGQEYQLLIERDNCVVGLRMDQPLIPSLFWKVVNNVGRKHS